MLSREDQMLWLSGLFALFFFFWHLKSLTSFGLILTLKPLVFFLLGIDFLQHIVEV